MIKMFRKSRFIISVLITLILFGCNTTQKYSAFRIKPEEAKRKIHKIAILPPVIPAVIQKQKDISGRYEALVRSAFKKVNIDTIPSKEYSKIYKPLKEKAGGIFDPMTGKPDKEKIKKIRKQAIRQMKEEFSIDSTIFMYITMVKIEWDGNFASWDGITESTTGRTGIVGVLLSPNARGTIPGLSLGLNIYDLEENLVYFKAGGIQLLKLVSGDEFIDIPVEQLFTDRSKDVRAVNVAMEPFYNLYSVSRKRGK